MLTNTLQRLIDENRTSAREIGELTGKAPSTVYRWISGKSEPDFNSIRLLVRHLPDRQAQQAIVSVFISGTSWHVMDGDHDLDVNQDGHVDHHDALDAAIMGVKSSSKSLVQIRATCRENRIEPDDVVTVMAHLDEVIQHCHIARRVLVQVCDNNRRKKLRLAK